MQGRTYETYMRLVDACLVHVVGLSHLELGDFPSRDCYENGVHPVDAAIICLAEQDCGIPPECVERLIQIRERVLQSVEAQQRE